jgi:threonylcarbamoyladenosine tRNA methylthiotransferase MtaB
LSSSETSNIARNFADEGYDRVEFKEYPIVVVKNTSSVTENVVKSFG